MPLLGSQICIVLDRLVQPWTYLCTPGQQVGLALHSWQSLMIQYDTAVHSSMKTYHSSRLLMPMLLT